MGSCKGWRPQGAAACVSVDAEPRSAAAAEAAAVVVNVAAAAAVVSADVNGGVAAVAAGVPSLGLCER